MYTKSTVQYDHAVGGGGSPNLHRHSTVQFHAAAWSHMNTIQGNTVTLYQHSAMQDQQVVAM